MANNSQILQIERQMRHGHRGGVLWFTGLSGSGKSTLSSLLARSLFDRGFAVAVLDGDQMRKGLCADLDFSPEDRKENLRRLAHVAKLLSGLGVLCITATISPLRRDREAVRAIMEPGEFHEVHINADLCTCEGRDPKGLYKKARAGLIPNFTGVHAPYEPPENPEFVADTQNLGIAFCLQALLDYSLTVFTPAGCTTEAMCTPLQWDRSEEK